MQILVYHYGALGDLITVLPVFSLLKKKLACSITLLGKPSFGHLARANDCVDEIMDAESGLNNYLFTADPDRERAGAFFSQFDRMYLFTDANSPLAANARIFSSADIIIHRPFDAKNKHIIDYNMEVLQDVAVSAGDAIPDLSAAISAFSRNAGNSISLNTDKPVAAFHPGSGSALKNWPMDSFLKAAGALRNKGYAIAWFTGPAEAEYGFPHTDMHFRNTPFPECAVLLSQCAVYCGNDSGITHLAAATGCPAVALFGPSNPEVWAPRGKSRVHVIYHRERCSPCHLKQPNPCKSICLRSISVEEVVNAMTFP